MSAFGPRQSPPPRRRARRRRGFSFAKKSRRLASGMSASSGSRAWRARFSSLSASATARSAFAPFVAFNFSSPARIRPARRSDHAPLTHRSCRTTYCRRRCAKHAYSITSVAWRRSVEGIVRPRVFAVLRLMTRSNFTGCSTGRSAGCAPLKILSTKAGARRKRSATLAHSHLLERLALSFAFKCRTTY